jgi:thiol-disulfide isomerase/thioredoxin
VLTGQYLVNFALYDLQGNPWEFQKHRGRLILLDFWETQCIPCQRAIPHLNVLNTKYGPRGLQVVGVAYEEGPLPEQAQKVDRVRQRLKMSYTLLLGGDSKQGPCPVKTQFAVRAFPTLVLVDDTGRILWRGEGLERQQLAELDLILRKRLGGR